MMDISKEQDEEKFIFFGCWNNGLCNSNETNISQIHNNDLTNTMLKMRQYQNSNPNEIDYMIVAGDNYYPSKMKKIKTEMNDKTEKTNKTNKTEKKNKKVKIINKDFLDSGFHCLQQIDIPKYILYGNHDIEFLNDDCEITRFQQEFTDNNTVFFHFDEQIQMHRICGNTIIIMLDTTIYDNETNMNCYLFVDGLKNDEQFKKLVENGENEEARQYVIEKQHTSVINIIHQIIASNDSIENIIFTGHHPILGMKHKGNKIKHEFMFEFANLIVDFIQSVRTFGRQFTFTHLCADIHNYQETTLTFHFENDFFVIEQYICGTGGADKDDVLDILPSEKNLYEYWKGKYNKHDFHISYKTKRNAISTNGFLICEIGRGIPSFRFLQTYENHTLTKKTIKSRRKHSSKFFSTRKSRLSKKSKKTIKSI